jgi:predicted RND superfamily exporter protein
LTTAAGFATFIITSSDILKEFGIISSLSIVVILVLDCYSIYYSYQPSTKSKHLEHLNRNYTKTFITWIEKRLNTTINVCVLVFVLVIGALKLKLW